MQNKIWLKHYFDMTGTYMDSRDLVSERQQMSLQATDSFRDVHRQPRNSKILLSEDHFVFQRERTSIQAAGKGRVLNEAYLQ